MEKENNKGLIFIALTGIIWGTQGVFIKMLDEVGIPSTFIAFDRSFMAVIFAAIISIFLYGFKAFKVTKKELFWCAVTGIVTQSIYNLTYSLTVKYVGVCIAVALLYLSPVFTALSSWIICKEKFGIDKKLILFINILGCVIAVTGLKFSNTSLSFFGILMGLIAALAYGLNPVLSRFSNKNPHVFIVIFYNNLFASLFILLAIRPSPGAAIHDIKNILLLIIFGILTCGVAYTLYYSGIKRLKELSKAPVVASTEIIAGTLAGQIFLDEKVGIVNFIGIGIVILSIYATTLKPNRWFNFHFKK